MRQDGVSFIEPKEGNGFTAETFWHAASGSLEAPGEAWESNSRGGMLGVLPGEVYSLVCVRHHWQPFEVPESSSHTWEVRSPGEFVRELGLGGRLSFKG